MQLYQGTGGSALPGDTATAAALWASPTLATYDLIVNACECSEAQVEKPQSSIDNLVAYANAGGRLFNTHYHYSWIDPSRSHPNGGASNPRWQFDGPRSSAKPHGAESPIVGDVDTTFPKGNAFASWLLGVGASAFQSGKLAIDDGALQRCRRQPRLRPDGSGPRTHDLTETYPLARRSCTTRSTRLSAFPDQQQCGKVLFS